MKAMETIKDLIDEAKLRAVWWSLCIFGVSYFLSRKHLAVGFRFFEKFFSDCGTLLCVFWL